MSDQLNSCPACDTGQSLERGEGTHLEGTTQHPIDEKQAEEYVRSRLKRVGQPSSAMPSMA